MAQSRIGFCCTYVSPTGDEQEQRALNMRQPTVASVAKAEQPAARLEEIIRSNLDVLDRQVLLVADLPPLQRLFRILSGFLIGWSHPLLAEIWPNSLRQEVERRLSATGEIARQLNVRLSMHPAQHAILATRSEQALSNAIGDIEEHARIFEMLGYGEGWHPHGASINVHGGARSAGRETIERSLDSLSASARNLVTIENDEVSFGLDDLLPLSGRVALVVDFHHHWVNSRGEWLQPEDERLERVRASWRGVRPLSHISVSRENLLEGWDPDRLPDFVLLEAGGLKASKLRGHSDRMWNRAVNQLVVDHLAWTDIEVEAKAKNLASADLAEAARKAGRS